MTRWKNSPEIREQEVLLTVSDLISMDITKMAELEFRIASIKILAGLEQNTKDTGESPSGEIKEQKYYQVEIKRLLRRCNKKKKKEAPEESRWRRSSRLRLLQVTGDQLDSLPKDCKHLQTQREIEEKNSNSRNRKSTTF